MSGYVILEIIICLSFIFLLYSLLATIVVEMVSSALRLRAKNFRRAIRRMLQDERTEKTGAGWWLVYFLFPRLKEKELVKAFFALPHVKYMGKNKVLATPSYMEASDFSKAMIDILAAEKGRSEMESIELSLKYSADFDKKNTLTEEEWKAKLDEIAKSADPKTAFEQWQREYQAREQARIVAFDSSDLNKLKDQVAKGQPADISKIAEEWKKELKPGLAIDPETRFALSSLYKDSGGDLNQFRVRLEGWFNSIMDRSKGWYKQRITLINLVIGFLIAWSFNINTIQIFSDLKSNTAKRDAIMLQAEQASSEELETLSDSLRVYTTNLNQTLGGPVGEDQEMPFVGWLLTAIAISFGAPFWFDLLNKFMKLRTSAGTAKADPAPAEKAAATGNSGDTFRDAKG